MCFLIFILDKKVVGSSPTRGSKAKSLKPSRLRLGWVSCFVKLC